MFSQKQYSPGGSGNPPPGDAAELFGTVVGIMFTLLYLPLAWRFTAPQIANLGDKTWGVGAGEPISAIWGICLMLIMFSVTKASAKIAFAAVALIIARFAMMIA